MKNKTRLTMSLLTEASSRKSILLTATICNTNVNDSKTLGTLLSNLNMWKNIYVIKARNLKKNQNLSLSYWKKRKDCTCFNAESYFGLKFWHIKFSRKKHCQAERCRLLSLLWLQYNLLLNSAFNLRTQQPVKSKV